MVMTNVLTTVAVIAAAAATVVYMFWAKAQEAKEAREYAQLCSNQNNQPMYYYQQATYTPPTQQGYYYQNNNNCYYEPQQLVYSWDPYANTWRQTYCNQSQVPNQSGYTGQYYKVMNTNGAVPAENTNSRRYMTQQGLNNMRVQNNGQQINATTTLYAPTFTTVPGPQAPPQDYVYEDKRGHRDMVDMHEWDVPAHRDEENGREYTKAYDVNHSYCEPSDYIEKEYYELQPMQKVVQFNADSIESGNWYNQPYGIPYFRHWNADDYLKNDEFNKTQQKLGIYYTPTQEYAMRGEPMPRIISPNAEKIDKSSIPYVSPEEKLEYMATPHHESVEYHHEYDIHNPNATPVENNAWEYFESQYEKNIKNYNEHRRQGKLYNSGMIGGGDVETHDETPVAPTRRVFKGKYYRTLEPGETPYHYIFKYYVPANQAELIAKLKEDNFYKTVVLDMTDDEFQQWYKTKDDPPETLPEVVDYSGHGEICGPENGGPDLSKYPLFPSDIPDPRRKIIIFDPSKDPKPLVKREGIPLSLQQTAQYWVNNGEAENCGYSYGDPTRPTTPVGTHYMAPKPWEDASYYNALFVDGGGIHYSYQDMLYEIRYRNIYKNPDDDPLIHLCPYDFETRTDLYNWRQAVFKKYKIDPYPLAMSDDIWRDDIQQYEYFTPFFNNNPNFELAKIAHYRWYRQDLEKRAWKRERENREKKARRDFYLDRVKGIHNIKFCPKDPTEYISPFYYEGLSGELRQHPVATDPDYYNKPWYTEGEQYYERMGLAEPGKYFNSNMVEFGMIEPTVEEPQCTPGVGKMFQHTPENIGPIDYFDQATYRQQYHPAEPTVNKDLKTMWVEYNPVFPDIDPITYNQASDVDYFTFLCQQGVFDTSLSNYDIDSRQPQWFDANQFWNNVPGDALLKYEEKKMRKLYPIRVDSRINENMIVADQTLDNTAGRPDDPFVEVFNLPSWYPHARAINNLLNRMQAPRGFRFTGDPEVDRQRIWYLMQKDTMTDVEKVEYLQDKMEELRNDPNYDPRKPCQVDGLTDEEKVLILMHNIGLEHDYPKASAHVWVPVGDQLDAIYDAWEKEHYAPQYSKAG